MFGYKSPKNIPGLVLWWDAADSTTINDGVVYQSQNVFKFVDKVSGKVLTNFAGANGPTYSYGAVNGKNAIHFPYYTDTNSGLKSLTNLNIDNINIESKTIFFVFKPTTNQYSNNTRYAFSIWGDGAAGGGLVEPTISIRSGGGTNPYSEYSESGLGGLEGIRDIFFRNEKSYQQGLKTSTNPDLDSLQIVISKTGFNSSLFRRISKFVVLQEKGFDSKLEYYNNDTLLFGNREDSQPAALNPLSISIGSYFYSSLTKFANAYPLEGYFCEMLYFNRYLEDYEINTIGSYLLRKWDPIRATFSSANIPIAPPPSPPPGPPGPPPPPSYVAPSITLDTTQIVQGTSQISNFIIVVTFGSQTIQDRGLVFSATLPNPVSPANVGFQKLTQPYDVQTSTNGTDYGTLTSLQQSTTYNVRAFVKDATNTYYSTTFQVTTNSITISRRTYNPSGEPMNLANPVDFIYADETNTYKTFWDVQISDLTPNTLYSCGIIAIAGGDYPGGLVPDLGESIGYDSRFDTNVTSDSLGNISNPSGFTYWNLNILNALPNTTGGTIDDGQVWTFRAFIIINSVGIYSDPIVEWLPSLRFLTAFSGGLDSTTFYGRTRPPGVSLISPDPIEVGFSLNTAFKDPYYNQNDLNSQTLVSQFEVINLIDLDPQFRYNYLSVPNNMVVKSYLKLSTGLAIWSEALNLGVLPTLTTIGFTTYVITSSAQANFTGEIRFSMNVTDGGGLIYGMESYLSSTLTPVEFTAEGPTTIPTNSTTTVELQGYGDFGERRWYRGYVRNSDSSFKLYASNNRNILLEDIRFVSFIYDAGIDSFVATILFNATSGRTISQIGIATKRGVGQDPAISLIGFNQTTIASNVSTTNTYTFNIPASNQYPLGSGNPILSGQSISGRVWLVVDGVRQFSFNKLSATKT